MDVDRPCFYIKFKLFLVLLSGELNHLCTINFCILGGNKIFFDKLYDALGLDQAYTSLKLRNKYNIVLICSFRLKTGNIFQL